MAKHTFDITRIEARQMYLELGSNRSLNILLQHLHKTYTKIPSRKTIATWCKEAQWVDAAKDFDADVQRKAHQKGVEKKSDEVHDFVSGLERVVAVGITHLEAMMENIKPTDAEGYAEFKICSDTLCTLLGKIEVMKGGVSDRKATDLRTTMDERKQVASNLAQEKLHAMSGKIANFEQSRRAAQRVASK